MSEQQNNPEKQSPGQPGRISPIGQEGLDPGGQALADALKWVFVLLKICIVCVIMLFIASGAYRVKPNELAVELRFGRVRGAGTGAIQKPGLHWRWPYVEEVIRIPADTAVRELAIDSFWYDEKAQLGRTLQFVRDGYSLTASGIVPESGLPGVSSDSGSGKTGLDLALTDYNLVHSKWVVRYFVSEPIGFVEQLWDGTKEGWSSVNRLLQDVLSDSVIVVSANRDIDSIVWRNPTEFREDVQRVMTKRLDSLGVGLKVSELNLVKKDTPRQVKEAFDGATAARSMRNSLLKTANAKANDVISKAEADAKTIVTEAYAYRETVVKSAEADAGYLDEVLAEVRKVAGEKFPDDQAKQQGVFDELLAVTVDQLYQETLREVMAGADESFVLPVADGKPVEWRGYLSRDPTLKKAGANKEKKQ
jgi:regulator of protease activity HflC (stomatin/prohibitin superfamily)